ncbi:MAG: hypothetical protein IJT14_01265 [Rickettsiales bacterium]|nr:hypothetical protein [Rickettsiales bacterium]
MIVYNGFDVPLLDEKEKDTYFEQYKNSIQRDWNKIKELKQNKEDVKKYDFWNGNVIDIVQYFIINFVDNEKELLKLQNIINENVPRNGYLVKNNPDIDKKTFFRILKYKDIQLFDEDNELKDYVFTLCCSVNFYKSLLNQIGFCLYNIEKKKNEHLNNLVLKSQEYAKSYGWKSILLFCLAFGWFLICEFFNFSGFSLQINDNRILMHFFEKQIYQKEIFIFLSKLLFKLPSFVLCLVGVKFLYLFVQYKTEEREFSMLDSYLEKIPNDCKREKAELIKQLAPHFFPDKKAAKISQGFLQELLRKALEK